MARKGIYNNSVKLLLALSIELIYNLGDKTILYLIFHRINGFVGV